MLKKLLNKEISDSKYLFIPIVILTCITCFLLNSYPLTHKLFEYLNISDSYLNSFTDVLTLFTTFALIVIFIKGLNSTFKYLYTNVYQEQGYELFTLPTRLSTIIIAKIITIVLWATIVIVTLIASISISDYLAYNSKNSYVFSYQFESIFENKNIIKLIYLLVWNILTVIKVASIIILAGAVVHTRYIQKFRAVFASLLVFIMLILSRLIESVIMAEMFNTLLNANLETLLFSGVGLPNFDLSLIVYLIIISIVLSLITLYIWQNKLELSASE